MGEELPIRQKMKIGELYVDNSDGLPEERLQAKSLLHEYNNLHPEKQAEKDDLLLDMFGKIESPYWIEQPLKFSYGKNVYIGKNFYANFNLVLIDDADIYIGDGVMIGPNVVISTAGHPENVELRQRYLQYSKNITIEDGVWIGSNVVINPGIRVGKNSIIGAGSVVTKDIPENVVAYGVPCRVIRPLDNNK